MTVCITAVPYIGQRRCSRYRFRLFDRFFFYGLSKAHSGTAAVLVDEFDARGGVLALRFLADGSDLKSSKDWVRFANVAGSHRFCFGGFRRRTPGPPFSWMKLDPCELVGVL